MISFFGTLSLVLALLFSLLQTILPIWGYYRHNLFANAAGRPCAWGQFAYVTGAYGLLTWAFVTNDYSIAYVAAHSHSALPLLYRIGAVWGGHEGSMLLWILFVNIWTVFTTLNQRLLATFRLTLSILGGINSLFLAFLLLSSNPFIPANVYQTGQDLNPLLQDPGFVLHPPFLYAGYVGFAVTFAITVSALLCKQLNSLWASYTKPYALAAWCLLTIGITLGSWWAYRVLGWGGFWFWDPVENASIMPWLAGIALIHILRLVEKRNVAINWACLLAIITFALSLLGTFLVRSGILISVHNFATDPKRGILLLFVMMIVVATALGIYFFHSPKKENKVNFSFYSKETTLLLQSVLLVTAMLTILFGTIYPLILDSLHLGRISVGAPYFNIVLLPIILLSLLTMGISSYWSWQKTVKSYKKKILRDLCVCSLIGLILSWMINSNLDITMMLTVSLCLWVFVSLRKSSLRVLGMQVAHTGFAVCILGIALSTSLKVERETILSINQPITVGEYEFTLLGTEAIHAKNYRGIRADIAVRKQGRYITQMQPEKRIYPVRQMVVTQTAINPSFFRDLYIALGEPLDANNWPARIYYKPFIRWIWLGALLMALGGLIALLQKKYYAGVSR